MSTITQEYLRQVFDYDQAGHLIWKRKDRGVKLGQKAGHITKDGYYLIRLDKVLYKGHRLIWLWHNGEWPLDELDHIDNNPSNNAIENLRNATKQQNMRNRGPNKNNALNIKNIHWDKAKKKFVVQFDGKFMKRFKTLEEAILVADEVRIKRHQDFARAISYA